MSENNKRNDKKKIFGRRPSGSKAPTSSTGESVNTTIQTATYTYDSGSSSSSCSSSYDSGSSSSSSCDSGGF